MKTKYIISTLTLGASICILTAQDGNPPRDDRRPPPREANPNEPGNARGQTRNKASGQKLKPGWFRVSRPR